MNHTATQKMNRTGMTAGVGLLLMAALGPFGIFVEGLATPGDAARTAANIIESEGLFRLGVASLFGMVALDVVVAWALYRVFRPVSEGLSMLAGWFRLAYAGVFLVAISQLVGVLDLLGTDDYLTVFSTDQLHARALLGIETFTNIWDAGLVLFGLHLLVIGYLAYRSGYVPRFLGVLLGIAGFGYTFDSLAAVVAPGLGIEIGAFTFVGELLLAFWLVVWGRRVTVSEPKFRDVPTAVAR